MNKSNYEIKSNESETTKPMELKDVPQGHIAIIIGTNNVQGIADFYLKHYILSTIDGTGDKIFVNLSNDGQVWGDYAGGYLNLHVRLLKPNEEIVIKGK